ncbi:MAG: rhomboid family intramembrane serine protease [Acidimicrobiia bacterium]|nr:rhomboid family intramembrane serine protease [Acidimicrobiia bacterium]
MIPIADENPVRHVPWMTLVLIGTCMTVFFLVQPEGSSLGDLGAERVTEEQLEFTLQWAAVPCEIIQGRPLTEAEAAATFETGDYSACGLDEGLGPAVSAGKNVYVAVLVSMLLHGNLAHLLGNVLFLWVFGNNVEDRKGPWRFLGLYVAAGLAAEVAHVAIDPSSTLPSLGASGAIAGVMGAYIVWFPRARVKCIIPLVPFVLFRKVAAGWVLGLWLAQQFLFIGGESGIAWAAHVGGFLFGAAVGFVWRRGRLMPPMAAPLAGAYGSS